MNTSKPNPKKTNLFRYLFKRDTLFATVLVFIVIGLFAKLETGLGILDPKEITSKDFDYNDLAFNLLNKHYNIPTDLDIFIVNIKDIDMKAIAGILKKVNLAKPKVIGIDVLLDSSANKEADGLLKTFLHNNYRVVLAAQLDTAGNRVPSYFDDSTIKPGFVNFTVGYQNVVREITPYIVQKDTLLSFSAACVKIDSPESFRKLLARGHKVEGINYTRSQEKFSIIDGSDTTTDYSGLTDKIVLLGTVDSGSHYEDKHFTPLNRKLTGKSLPDMSGVVIHANIIRMMLDNNYINHTNSVINWGIAFILCWLHMALFIRYWIEKHIWFHLVVKIAQLASAIIFIYLGLIIFYNFNAQIDLTDTLIAIILAVDVLYFYEAGVIWLHQKKGFKTLFHHEIPN